MVALKALEVAQGPLGHAAVMHAGSSRIPPAQWMPTCGFHGHRRGGAAGVLIGHPGTHRRSSGSIAFTVVLLGGAGCGSCLGLLGSIFGTFFAPKGQDCILQNEVLCRTSFSSLGQSLGS